MGLYRDTYVKEIKRRLTRKEGLVANDKIETRVMDIWGKPAGERDSDLLARALHGEAFKYREFPRMIIILMSILERI